MIAHSAGLLWLPAPLSELAKDRRFLTIFAAHNTRLQSRSCREACDESIDGAVHSEVDIARRLVTGDTGWDCQGRIGCRIYLRPDHGCDCFATLGNCRWNRSLLDRRVLIRYRVRVW